MDKMMISRRSLLKATVTGAGIALAAPMIARSAFAQTKQIVIRTPGGPTAIAMQKSYYDPFEAATGIKVIPATSTNEPVSQVKAIVESGAKTWDMAASFSRSTISQLIKDGDYLEPHGLSDDPAIAIIPKAYRNDFAVGHGIYATPITYRTDKYQTAPKNWADFFNVEQFPGPRAMRKNPVETLEIALMADGVPREQLYPLDIDRAFKSLSRIKPHISNWWTTPVQATELIVNGDVYMVPVWVNFPVAAIGDGAPLGLCWQNNIFGVDMFTILKGSPNVDACREFIKFSLQAKQQAGVASQVAIAPTNPDAFALIPPERARLLASSPENSKDAVEINSDFWSANRDAISDRFNEWLLE
jgi:putative spermidine/putrescine transport system substrate-binding protein